MREFMNYRISAIVVIVLVLILTSCDDKPIAPVELEITSITPNSGFVGDTITITGRSFGTVQDTSYISFPFVKCFEIISWSNTEIILKIPIGAKSGKVSVNVNGIISNELDFIVNTKVIDDKVIDIDGNEYNFKSICGKMWMTENLDVSHYLNGDTIPQVTDPVKWAKLKTGAWCYYNNDPLMGAIYGKLYNCYAVNDKRGLAPAGWHIPTDEELTELSDCLSGDVIAGGKLKSIGTIETGDGLWESPNANAKNSSGFSGLPGGYRGVLGKFFDIGAYSYWWSSNKYYNDENDSSALYRFLIYNSSDFSQDNYFMDYGMAIRCVKN